MSKRAPSPSEDEEPPRKLAKITHEKKKFFRFTVELDTILLKLIIEHNPYGAPHGTMEGVWEEIANKINEALVSQDKEGIASKRTVRERAATIINKYRRGDPKVVNDGNSAVTEYQSLVQQLINLRTTHKKSESEWKIDLCTKTPSTLMNFPTPSSSSRKMNIENLLGDLHSPTGSSPISETFTEDATTRQQFEELSPSPSRTHSLDKKVFDCLNEMQATQRRTLELVSDLTTLIQAGRSLMDEEREFWKEEYKSMRKSSDEN